MAVACIAFALVCYQRVPSPLWTVLLAISLALAQSLHYLAVLAMVPFGLAEVVHFLETRKFRWPVWAALVVGASPLLLFWKLIAANKAYYGAHFWAHLPFSAIPRAYGELLETSSQLGAGIAAVALAGILGTALWPRAAKTDGARREEQGAGGSGPAIHHRGPALCGIPAHACRAYGIGTEVFSRHGGRRGHCSRLHTVSSKTGGGLPLCGFCFVCYWGSGAPFLAISGESYQRCEFERHSCKEVHRERRPSGIARRRSPRLGLARSCPLCFPVCCRPIVLS